MSIETRTVNRLRGAVYARYDSLTAFAKDIGWSRPKVNKAMKDPASLAVKDARKIASTLNLEAEEYDFIFTN
jgi:DNA-binding phage protein